MSLNIEPAGELHLEPPAGEHLPVTPASLRARFGDDFNELPDELLERAIEAALLEYSGPRDVLQYLAAHLAAVDHGDQPRVDGGASVVDAAGGGEARQEFARQSPSAVDVDLRRTKWGREFMRLRRAALGTW